MRISEKQIYGHDSRSRRDGARVPLRLYMDSEFSLADLSAEHRVAE